jgi:hypothetical protein
VNLSEYTLCLAPPPRARWSKRLAGAVAQAALGAMVLVLASCRSLPPDASTSSGPAAADAGVRRMAASIARDLARDGPNAWLHYFVDRPEFFMANNGTLQFASYAEAAAFLPNFAVGVAHLELAWGDIRVDPVAPGAAVMAASYREVFTDKGGHVAKFSGFFTGTAVETAQGWKLRDAHWSSPLPPP